ncbi:YceI family protein [Novosphingobium sp. BL-52-GroH]|uniref:YceI family protein n=1 Tax=Novosphingobium sp. BL-52-GroH TaxID=3349877 RepID=UPI0038512603
MKFIPALAAVLPFLSVPALAAPPVWAPVAASSNIGFGGTYTGKGFTGRFSQWQAAIRFDPADLAHSSASVTISTASAATGDPFKDTTLTGGEWFDTARFPRATFVTKRITAAGPGRYVADGELTIKGKAIPVKLPFTLRITGNMAVMNGTTKVDRIAAGLGARSDPSGSWVGRPITLTIAVTARRMK